MKVSPLLRRLFMLDDARTCSTLGAFRRQIAFLAKSGINGIIWHFSDDQGCRVRFESRPEIGSRPSFSPAEVRQLVCFARKHGVSIIPELASLGHSRYITRLPHYEHLNEHAGPYSGICPVHPQTRDILRDLVHETIAIFDPPAVHVGLDEVDIGEHPLTRAALETQTRSQIFADHMHFLRDLVINESGRQMWVWGDQLLACPELRRLVPKDIVVCNWQYTPDADAASTQTLLDDGFNVLTASALLSYGQTLLPSRDYALENVARMREQRTLRGRYDTGRVLGEIVTTWIPQRSVGSAQWLGWHLAAAILDGGDTVDFDAAIRSFGGDFYGMEQTDDWLDAARAVVDHAPARPDWLPVIRLDCKALSADQRSKLAARARHWADTATALNDLRPAVRREGDAFDAFVLVVELLAHAYDAAAHLCRPAAEATRALPRLVRRRKQLLEAVATQWDQDRFADDPAKTESVITYFRDEHLLLIIADGLAALERAANRAMPQPATVA